MPAKGQKNTPGTAKKTSPAMLRRQERIAEAMDYRRRGYSFVRIGEAMKCDPSTAYDMVRAGLDQLIREPAEEVRNMELERLDEMQAGVYGAAVGGDLQAIQTMLKLQERRAKLLGVDAPEKREHTGKDGGPIHTKSEVSVDAARSALAEALAKAGLADPAREGDRKSSG